MLVHDHRAVIAGLDPAIHDEMPQAQSVLSQRIARPHGCPDQARA
jgi:hypothetical protein